MNPISAALSIGDTLIKRLFPDPEQQAKAKIELADMAQRGDLDELSIRMQAITSEIKSDSWLAANWRPMLMCAFGAIIVNNYILAPYLGVLFGVSVTLDIPPDMWNLLKLGIGGYVVGRSGEKMMKAWKAS